MRARVRVELADYAGAIEDAQIARTLGAGAEALELVAWSAHFLKDDATAVELGEEGARLASDANVRASCLTVSGWARTSRGELPAAQAQLEQAHAMATGPARTMAAAWLGAVRIFQGDTGAGLSLLGPLVTMGIGSWHSQPLTYAHMLRSMAFGYEGRPLEALRAVDEFEAETDRTGSSRFGGRAANIRGWILRGLGESALADESNQQALEVADAGRFIEPLSHAHLDLAAGALAAGRIDETVEHLDAVDAVQHLPHSLRWRHRLRARLLRARVAMSDGAWDVAEAEASGAVEAATELHAVRQLALAEVLVAEIRFRRGDAVDHAAVEGVLERLPRLAGLEAWWITADLADAANVDAWRTMAQRRAVDLASRAGPHRAAVEAAAARRFG
jgi:tetratricopeptide (TPR) repeat protein